MRHAENPEASKMLLGLLILMSILGAFPLDVILPSFQAISIDLNVDSSHIAQSVGIFTVCVALSQCVIGPLSDHLGRKNLLCVGLLLAMAGAYGCTLARDYTDFIIFRGIQSMGCGCFVLSQALVQDRIPANNRNSFRIILATISGAFISFSPFFGSVLQNLSGWRASFYVFVGLSVLTIAVLFKIPNERNKNPSHSRTMSRLLFDLPFITYSLIAALAFACHFSFVIVSPLIFIDALSFTEYEFSLIFLIYGAAYVAGGYMAGLLNRKLKLNTQMLIGSAMIAFAGMTMLVAIMSAGLSVVSILLPMIICTAGTTITRPAATSLALERHPQIAGACAALNSTLVFLVGGMTSGLLAWLEGDRATYLSLGLIMVGLATHWVLKVSSSRFTRTAA